jgi:hypothetical protein
MPPIAAPELKIPCAKARSLIGNHSALALVAPGQLPASATPSNPRNSEKLNRPLATACSIVAADQATIDRTKPSRVPIQSKILPKIVWPNA